MPEKAVKDKKMIFLDKEELAWIAQNAPEKGVFKRGELREFLEEFRSAFPDCEATNGTIAKKARQKKEKGAAKTPRGGVKAVRWLKSTLKEQNNKVVETMSSILTQNAHLQQRNKELEAIVRMRDTELKSVKALLKALTPVRAAVEQYAKSVKKREVTR